MQIRSLVLFAILSAFGTCAFADEVSVSFDVVVAGAAPQHVRLDDGASGAELSNANNTGTFSGAIAIPNDQIFHEMRLIADYGDLPEEAVPLRLRSEIKAVRVRVSHITNLSCDNTTVTHIEQSTTLPDDLVRSYLIARDLHFSYNVTSPCGTFMLKRVDKAWFDRSYGLTLARPFFALDDDARAAYGNYDRAYVELYSDQDSTHKLALLNVERVRLAKNGDFAAAVSANDALVKALQADDHLRTKFGQLQRLPLSQLLTEGAALKAQIED